ncbi:MAG: hypothetical protein IPH22_03440 [Nitrosomonas sp.]|nr:hypothetical protein [Nitrosomonas sp.]
MALLITVQMLQGEASEQVVPLPVGDANRVPLASAVATKGFGPIFMLTFVPSEAIVPACTLVIPINEPLIKLAKKIDCLIS